MGTCMEILVLIQQKWIEKTHPGRITITRGRISVFSAIARKTDFLLGGCTEHLYLAAYLPSGRPTSGISFDFPY